MTSTPSIAPAQETPLPSGILMSAEESGDSWTEAVVSEEVGSTSKLLLFCVCFVKRWLGIGELLFVINIIFYLFDLSVWLPVMMSAK